MSARSVRHVLEHRAFRTVRWLFRSLPEAVAVRAGAFLGLVAGSVLRIRRADVDRHLVLAFPDRSEAWRGRVARACYTHLGREATMLFRMPGSSAKGVLERVSFTGLEDLKAAARAGTGAVVLTGHLGNWEMAGAAIAASGIDLDAVARGMANRRFEADLFEAREQLGLGLIDRDEALKGVLRSLRKGRVVAILGDQNASDGGVFVPFFGELAATARGPALFALRTGAPLFFGAVVREPGWRQHYTCELRHLELPATGDVEADVRAVVLEYTRLLERAIRRAPEQYFWHHRRWKTRPPRNRSPGPG